MPRALAPALALLPAAAVLASGLPEAGDFALFALIGAAISGGLRAALPLPPRLIALLPAACLLAAAGLWGAFFIADLHRARFAWTLLLAPAGALIGAATGRSARAAAIGAIGGLNVVWALLVLRSDNGCTGYSAAFSAVLALHPIIGIWPAPLLARAPAPPAG